MVIGALVLWTTMIGASTPGRAEYDRAAKLYAQERYEEALPWFERAYQRSGHRPSVTFGLAQCERSLGLLDRAEAHLEEFLQTASKRRHGRARRLLAKVRAEKLERAASVVAARPRAPPPDPAPAAPPPAVQPAPPPPWKPPPPAVVADAPVAEEESILRSPVLWIVAGAVVVAGAVTAGVLLSASSPDPYGGTAGHVFRP